MDEHEVADGVVVSVALGIAVWLMLLAALGVL